MRTRDLILVSVLTTVIAILLRVLIPAQTVTNNTGLSFGNVFPGVAKAIDKKTAGAAAEFQITGTAGAEVTVDFTLPQYLNKNGFNMPLIFQDTDCAIDTSASPDQSNPTVDNLDPWDTITYRLGSSGMTIWLGGTLTPKLAQPPGSYSGLIVVTVTYTGL